MTMAKWSAASSFPSAGSQIQKSRVIEVLVLGGSSSSLVAPKKHFPTSPTIDLRVPTRQRLFFLPKVLPNQVTHSLKLVL